MNTALLLFPLYQMFKFLTLLTFLPFLVSPAPLSPLRLGADHVKNDIYINYNFDFSNYMVNFNSNNDADALTLCFRLKPIIDGTDKTCELGNSTGNFDCVAFELGDLTNQKDDISSKWIMSSDYTTIINKSSWFPSCKIVDVTQNAYSLCLMGLENQTSQRFSFVANEKGVFEVITSNMMDLTNPSADIRHNYMITFFDNFSVDSDNVLVQRQVHCYLHDNVYNLVFMGGVVRDGNPIFIIAVANYHKTKNQFLIWEGISFSHDKVLRDMVGFYPSQGYCEDLYSLYASAPFLDTSENINGTDDYNIIGTSDSVLTSNMGWFYYMQAYRYYDTGDIKGDEILQFKINNQFCYAAYITSESDDVDSYFLYNNKKYKHQLLRCFEPSLDLYMAHATAMVLVVAMTVLSLL